MTRMTMQLVFCCNALREFFGYLQRLSHLQDIATKFAKTFSYKPVLNHTQVKDKWEKFKKKYIARKKAKGVTRSIPLEWCWFDHIDQILIGITKDNLPRREDMETPACNSHQITEDVDHHTKPKCKELPPPRDASSPMHTSLVFVDVTCINASPITPCTRVYHRQGVNGKFVSRKHHKNSKGANNIIVTLSSFRKYFNQVEILKVEAKKEATKQFNKLA